MHRSLLACLALLLPSLEAQGRDEHAAAMKAKEALTAFDSGRFEEALSLYRAAHDLAPLPAISFAEARCLEELGRIEEALVAARRALAEGPSKDLKSRIVKKIAYLEERMKTGRLVIKATPAGAEVLLDGNPLGRAPVEPVEVERGYHRVTVRTSAQNEVTQVVEVRGGRESIVEVSMREPTGRLSVKAPVPNADVFVDGKLVGQAPAIVEALQPGPHRVEVRLPGRSPVVEVAEVRDGDTTSIEIEAPSGGPRAWYKSSFGWSLAGAGIAGLATGAILLGLAASDRDEVKSALDARSPLGPSQQELRDKWDRADRMATAGYVVTSLGGAATVASIVVFVVNAKRSSQTAWIPACVGQSCALSVRF